MVAITRDVSEALADCELTYLARAPIDVGRARAQHLLYRQALEEAGYRVEQLPAGPEMPDSVFVEDIAVVFPELAVVMRPGAESRRIEVSAVAMALTAYRRVIAIEAPGTIDGGDVLTVGPRVYVGRSARTNADGIAQMRRALTPYGYTVCDIDVKNCLHLKSAATCVAGGTVLVNPDWVDGRVFGEYDVVTVAPQESGGANALRLHDRVIVPAAFPHTADRLAARGLQVVMLDASELAKAEGAVTCCSLLLED